MKLELKNSSAMYLNGMGYYKSTQMLHIRIFKNERDCPIRINMDNFLDHLRKGDQYLILEIIHIKT